jgi:hypothetical protein
MYLWPLVSTLKSVVRSYQQIDPCIPWETSCRVGWITYPTQQKISSPVTYQRSMNAMWVLNTIEYVCPHMKIGNLSAPLFP